LHCSHCSLKCFSSSVSPWSGLHSWRNNPLNENRNWGPLGPQPEPVPEPDLHHSPFGEASSLSEFGSIVLSTTDPLQKSHLSHVAYSLWRTRNLPLGQSVPPSQPARPEKPQLVCSLFRPPPVCFNSWIAYLMTHFHYLKPHYGKITFFFFLWCLFVGSITSIVNTL
jgi:hypothetical protein